MVMMERCVFFYDCDTCITCTYINRVRGLRFYIYICACVCVCVRARARAYACVCVSNTCSDVYAWMCQIMNIIVYIFIATICPVKDMAVLSYLLKYILKDTSFDYL